MKTIKGITSLIVLAAIVMYLRNLISRDAIIQIYFSSSTIDFFDRYIYMKNLNEKMRTFSIFKIIRILSLITIILIFKTSIFWYLIVTSFLIEFIWATYFFIKTGKKAFDKYDDLRSAIKYTNEDFKRFLWKISDRFKTLAGLKNSVYVPYGWELIENQNTELKELDLSKIKLVNVSQDDLLDPRALNASWLDEFLRNQHLIPKEWKEIEKIYFPMTIYKSEYEQRVIRCLEFKKDRKKWYWGNMLSNYDGRLDGLIGHLTNQNFDSSKFEYTIAIT